MRVTCMLTFVALRREVQLSLDLCVACKLRCAVELVLRVVYMRTLDLCTVVQLILDMCVSYCMLRLTLHTDVQLVCSLLALCLSAL